jgi:hypothetical protein
VRPRLASDIVTFSTDLIEALAAELNDLMSRVSDAVDALAPGVNSAADAIAAGSAEHWKTVADARPEYDNIRQLQRTLYRCGSIEFDDLKCGDGINGNDPEGRIYYHRNLSSVAPQWRGWRDSNGADHPPEVPWSNGPVEQLVWFVRTDSGIWCPTPRPVAHVLEREPSPAQVFPPRGKPLTGRDRSAMNAAATRG